MSASQIFDVIVAGGGPGGALAAKRCTEGGFNTLLIERKKLPRDKVCTGMVVGDWARHTIRQEFGEIPGTVLVDPPHSLGCRIYVQGAEPRSLEWDAQWAWRKDLDYWMVQRAIEAGVPVREGCKLVQVTSEQGEYAVAVQQNGVTETLRARYVIGADGATSAVRGSIFPELKVRYTASARKCYRGTLGLEKTLVHYFYPKGRPRPRFGLYHKNDMFVVEGRAIRELRAEINEVLAQYGYNLESEPERQDSAPIALMHEQLLSGSFTPAEGNTLLVGDAAGLLFPVTFEGIGTALRSGIAAAESIAKSAETGKPAAAFYLKGLEPILETLRHLRAHHDALEKGTYKDAASCAEAIVAAYRETLTCQRQ